jgi:hypothetical protein
VASSAEPLEARVLEEGLQVARRQVAAEHAREGPHERHADLGGGEELVDALLELLDPLRAAAAFVDQGLDPAPARGDDRDLAAREEAVAEQAEHDRDCDEDRFGHGLSPGLYQSARLVSPRRVW